MSEDLDFSLGDLVVVKSLDEIDRGAVDYVFVPAMEKCCGKVGVVSRIGVYQDDPTIELNAYDSENQSAFSRYGFQWSFAPQWLKHYDLEDFSSVTPIDLEDLL